MEVYHGSLKIVEKPNIDILNFRTDFGKGFYTTTDLEQARRWTRIKRERAEKEEIPTRYSQYVNVYEYIENSNLHILKFHEATEEWLDFVFENRNSNHLLHHYDIVVGPVANDNLYATLRLYERNYISKKETIKTLKTYKLNNQISFHTEQALKTIHFLKAEEVPYE